MNLANNQGLLSESILTKLQSLCNNFGKEYGLDHAFNFKEKLFSNAKTESLLDLNGLQTALEIKLEENKNEFVMAEFKKEFDSVMAGGIDSGLYSQWDSQEVTKSDSTDSDDDNLSLTKLIPSKDNRRSSFK